MTFICVLLRGRAGDRALHVTASVGCSDTLKALINAGVDVNSLNSARQSALYLALKNDKPQVATVRHGIILTTCAFYISWRVTYSQGWVYTT